MAVNHDSATQTGTRRNHESHTSALCRTMAQLAQSMSMHVVKNSDRQSATLMQCGPEGLSHPPGHNLAGKRHKAVGFADATRRAYTDACQGGHISHPCIGNQLTGKLAYTSKHIGSATLGISRDALLKHYFGASANMFIHGDATGDLGTADVESHHRKGGRSRTSGLVPLMAAEDDTFVIPALLR